MPEFASLADAKAHLSELVSRVGSQHDRVTVTVHGRPTAVLLAVDDLEATIAVLSDAAAIRALAEADSELARGEGETEDALREAIRPGEPLRERGSLHTGRRSNRASTTGRATPRPVTFAAYEFIIGPLLTTSRRVGKQLRPPLDDRHSARRGPYRVIYRIDDQQRTVTVVGVFPRSNAHRTG